MVHVLDPQCLLLTLWIRNKRVRNSCEDSLVSVWAPVQRLMPAGFNVWCRDLSLCLHNSTEALFNLITWLLASWLKLSSHYKIFSIVSRLMRGHHLLFCIMRINIRWEIFCRRLKQRFVISVQPQEVQTDSYVTQTPESEGDFRRVLSSVFCCLGV